MDPEQCESVEIGDSSKLLLWGKGHRAFSATMDTISSEYWWTDMTIDIKEVIYSYIHCIVPKNSERIACLLSTALHGKEPIEAIHPDFLYMTPAEERNMKYVPIIKEDIGSYTCLCPYSNAESDAATTDLENCITGFGGIMRLMTD